MTSMKKNLHVPLSKELNEALKAEAKRSGTTATEMARQGIRLLLERRRREALHQQIRSYARALAGTDADLDSDLESASAEHLFESESQ